MHKCHQFYGPTITICGLSVNRVTSQEWLGETLLPPHPQHTPHHRHHHHHHHHPKNLNCMVSVSLSMKISLIVLRDLNHPQPSMRPFENWEQGAAHCFTNSVYVYNTCIDARTHARMHARTHTRTYIHTRTHIQTRARAHTHTHTHVRA